MSTALQERPLQEPPKWRWTVGDFHRAVDVGLLPERGGIELIDGEVYFRMPQGQRHVLAIRRVAKMLEANFGSEYIIFQQAPLQLSEYGEPEPDVMVLRGQEEDYVNNPPRPEDVVLAIEIAETSLTFDRTVKAREYALAGVQEMWIVNLLDRCVEVYRLANDKAYTGAEVFLSHSSIPLPNPSGTSVLVSTFLPPVA